VETDLPTPMTARVGLTSDLGAKHGPTAWLTVRLKENHRKTIGKYG